jgi:hypothetical protein
MLRVSSLSKLTKEVLSRTWYIHGFCETDLTKTMYFLATFVRRWSFWLSQKRSFLKNTSPPQVTPPQISHPVLKTPSLIQILKTPINMSFDKI